jgi:ATP-dependent DNA helicase RecQ
MSDDREPTSPTTKKKTAVRKKAPAAKKKAASKKTSATRKAASSSKADTTATKAPAKKKTATRKKTAATSPAAKKTAASPARKKAAVKKKAAPRKKASSAASDESTLPEDRPEPVEEAPRKALAPDTELAPEDFDDLPDLPDDLPALQALPDDLAEPPEELVAAMEQIEEEDDALPEVAEDEPARRKPRGKPRTPSDAAAWLGIQQLRPEQEQVIDHVLAGRHTLMIVPTGSGKSACYQIPSMLLPKPVVMISPLLALLEDQHQKMLAAEVPCVRLDGSVRGRARRETLERIEEGGSLLIMTTPETLAKPELTELLAKTGVSLVAVDEAHCISEWGYDFRPAYRRIGAQIQALGNPAVLALTATATEHVRDAIIQSLRMESPEVIAFSPHRSNLAFEVLPAEGDVRARVLIRLIKRLRRPGIVYCSTRREVDMVWGLLKRFRIPCHRYHGGMTAAERDQEQRRYMRRGHRTVTIATNAFGLGIDKPDIRYVLHYQAPASLEQYVQEAGRGGRDGKKSNCILLYDPADRQIHQALLNRSRIRPDQLFKLGSALAAWSDESRSPSLEALALSADLGPRITQALLGKIEEAGFVDLEDSEIRVVNPESDIEEDTRSLAGDFELVRRQDARRLDSIEEYAVHTNECRAVFLRGYFGEETDEDCGLCDVCRGRPKRPTNFFAPLTLPKQPKRKGRGRRGGRGGGRARSGGRGGRGRQAEAEGGGRGRGPARGRGEDARAEDRAPNARGEAGGERGKPTEGENRGARRGRPGGGRPRRSRRRRGRRGGGGGGGGGRNGGGDKGTPPQS